MRKLILFLVMTFFMSSCGEECYNAPLPVIFEFVDDNGNNLITNGTLNPFSVMDENQVGVALTKTDDGKVILENVGIYNGTKNYTFYSPVRFFQFSIESSEYKGGCNGYQINKLTFTGIAIDVTDQKGYYQIVLK